MIRRYRQQVVILLAADGKCTSYRCIGFLVVNAYDPKTLNIMCVFPVHSLFKSNDAKVLSQISATQFTCHVCVILRPDVYQLLLLALSLHIGLYIPIFAALFL